MFNNSSLKAFVVFVAMWAASMWKLLMVHLVVHFCAVWVLTAENAVLVQEVAALHRNSLGWWW